MKILQRIALLALLTITVACQYPVREVSTGGDAATIEFVGNHDEALLIVNGVELGQISALVEKHQKLEVPTGTNKIVVLREGAVIYETTVFLSVGESEQILLQ